jgi:hypothetical protein
MNIQGLNGTTVPTGVSGLPSSESIFVYVKNWWQSSNHQNELQLGKSYKSLYSDNEYIWIDLGDSNPKRYRKVCFITLEEYRGRKLKSIGI